jgi:hypothetical protein
MRINVTSNHKSKHKSVVAVYKCRTGIVFMRTWPTAAARTTHVCYGGKAEANKWRAYSPCGKLQTKFSSGPASFPVPWPAAEIIYFRIRAVHLQGLTDALVPIPAPKFFVSMSLKINLRSGAKDFFYIERAMALWSIASKGAIRTFWHTLVVQI